MPGGGAARGHDLTEAQRHGASRGGSLEEFLEDFPTVKRQDAMEFLQFARRQ
jgi:uncharacterized protein (DUF433 family)